MKKNLLIFVGTIILFLTYIFVNFTIGNDNFKFVKDIFPNYFNWKYHTKKIFFPKSKFEKKFKDKFLIKSDSLNVFKIKPSESIYIYSENKYGYGIGSYNYGKKEFINKNDIKIFIENINHTKNKICFEHTFKQNYRIKINNLIKSCKNSIFLRGTLFEVKYPKKKIYFYFSIESNRKNINKNLIVLPVSNFYNYSSNLLTINQNSVTNISYIANSNEVPHSDKIIWSEKLSKSIFNISKIIEEFDLVHDYEFVHTELDNYTSLIFPLHQEYVSEPFLNKIKNFLKKDQNRTAISIGGANFFRKIKFVDNKDLIQFEFFDNIYNQTQNYKINSFDFNKYSNLNCKYNTSNNELELLQLGDLSDPIIDPQIRHFFYDIKCDNDINLPLVSLTTYNKKGKLIHINSDNVGLNFLKIPKLKQKILDNLN